MKISFATRIALILTPVALLAATDRASAQHHHRRRACLYRCIPLWDYAEDHDRVRTSAIAAADPEIDLTWLSDALSRPGKPLSYDAKWPVRKKRFHMNPLSAGHITLDRVGLAIYDTGHLRCSGRITHDGGPGGDLRDTGVVIQVRAYAAANDDSNSLVDASLIWESSEHRIRVRRDRPMVVRLAPESVGACPQLRRHFDEITHLEVELQYERDR